ncbi:hypothetical protein AwDysgo_08840 [Bacteroidales bacterium]|nr:hypothetical protein AwDysgo_08840 [Bacteroidales bacterium]
MKNYHQTRSDCKPIKTQRSINNIALIMKTTCLLLLFSTGNLGASLAYAQSTKLSLKMTNTSIEKVLEKIESQS